MTAQWLHVDLYLLREIIENQVVNQNTQASSSHNLTSQAVVIKTRYLSKEVSIRHRSINRPKRLSKSVRASIVDMKIELTLLGLKRLINPRRGACCGAEKITTVGDIFQPGIMARSPEWYSMCH